MNLEYIEDLIDKNLPTLNDPNIRVGIISAIAEAIDTERELQREICARICEELPVTIEIAACEFDYEPREPTAEDYAAAIRTKE
jgi:hypothetical protein